MILFFNNGIIICYGMSPNAYSSTGEVIQLPITYKTIWRGFGGPVNFRTTNQNTTCIPACIFVSVSQASVCNRYVQVQEADSVNYLTIGY